MCGIVGIIRPQGPPVAREQLGAMTAALAHRGPDDEGFVISGIAGLGHRRLSIIDLSPAGRQPLANEDSTIFLVQNGEIYNYVELRALLESKGHVFTSHSDSEVILHLYEEEGAAGISRLNGMFAFALWDSKRQKLLAARDRVGIKPFYYWDDSGSFVWASEPKAFLPAGLRVAPDPDALADFLAFGFGLGDNTFFKGVRKLLPGHQLTWEAGKVEVRPYWRLPEEEAGRAAPIQVLAAELRPLLEDAVRLQLRSDVPLGCHLSGGLDSSTVTCLAARQLGHPLQTFSGAFGEGPAYDERPYAREVVKATGAQAFEITPGAREFESVLPFLIHALDEPVVGPGSFPQLEVSRLAARHVKVILGGQGGDELFAGYPRHRESALLAETGGRVKIWKPKPACGADLYYDAYHAGSLRFYLDLLEKELALQIDRDGPRERLRAVFGDDDRPLAGRVMSFDVLHYLPGLLQVEDRVSMAVSLESRVPLLDHRVVEWAARIPARTRLAGKNLKGILRAAMADLVPEAVISRTDKVGFSVPLGQWIAGELAPRAHHILGCGEGSSRRVWNPAGVKRLIQQQARGEEHGHHFWTMLSLAAWFDIFVDGRVPSYRS